MHVKVVRELFPSSSNLDIENRLSFERTRLLFYFMTLQRVFCVRIWFGLALILHLSKQHLDLVDLVHFALLFLLMSFKQYLLWLSLFLSILLALVLSQAYQVI